MQHASRDLGWLRGERFNASVVEPFWKTIVVESTPLPSIVKSTGNGGRKLLARASNLNVERKEQPAGRLEAKGQGIS